LSGDTEGFDTMSSFQVFAGEYARQYDAIYSEKNYGEESDALEKVFRQFGGGRIRNILDLGCGTGSHSLILARRGYHVHGVELSPSMEALARQKADAMNWISATQKPVFQVGDVRSVRLKENFDAAIMMFSVLGYLTRNSEVLETFHNVRRHLASGGLFACEVWYGPTVLLNRPTQRSRVFDTPAGKVERTGSGRLDVNRHLVEICFTLKGADAESSFKESTEIHPVRFYFSLELEFFLSLADFDLVSLTAFPEIEKEAGENTWNVLAVARAGRSTP